jgi:hypothetical protein
MIPEGNPDSLCRKLGAPGTASGQPIQGTLVDHPPQTTNLVGRPPPSGRPTWLVDQPHGDDQPGGQTKTMGTTNAVSRPPVTDQESLSATTEAAQLAKSSIPSRPFGYDQV